MPVFEVIAEVRKQSAISGTGSGDGRGAEEVSPHIMCSTLSLIPAHTHAPAAAASSAAAAASSAPFSFAAVTSADTPEPPGALVFGEGTVSTGAGGTSTAEAVAPSAGAAAVSALVASVTAAAGAGAGAEPGGEPPAFGGLTSMEGS